jgi:hypothetical protein
MSGVPLPMRNNTSKRNHHAFPVWMPGLLVWMARPRKGPQPSQQEPRIDTGQQEMHTRTSMIRKPNRKTQKVIRQSSTNRQWGSIKKNIANRSRNWRKESNLNPTKHKTKSPKMPASWCYVHKPRTNHNNMQIHSGENCWEKTHTTTFNDSSCLLQ